MKLTETLKALNAALAAEIKVHNEDLRGESGRGSNYEDGFIKGLEHVRDNLLPAITTECGVCGRSDKLCWLTCIKCKGRGYLSCICEGVGGQLVCGYDCDELADGYDEDQLIQHQLSMQGV